jgi:hypothetical protein
MRNNKTSALAPLRVSENVNVLTQQIQGLIKRDGSGQFENVQPLEKSAVRMKSVKKKK